MTLFCCCIIVLYISTTEAWSGRCWRNNSRMIFGLFLLLTKSKVQLKSFVTWWMRILAEFMESVNLFLLLVNLWHNLLRYGIFVGKCGILVIFFQKVVCELRFEYIMGRWTVFFNHVTWCCRSGECFRNLRLMKLMKLCFWFVYTPRLPPLGRASLLGARFSDALAD